MGMFFFKIFHCPHGEWICAMASTRLFSRRGGQRRTVTMQWSCLTFDCHICTGLGIPKSGMALRISRLEWWDWSSLSPGVRLVWWSSLYPLATEHWKGLCGSFSREEVSHPKDPTNSIWKIKCLYKDFFFFSEWLLPLKIIGNKPQEKFYLARSSTSTKPHAEVLNILSHLATKCRLPWRQCLWIPINFFTKYSSSVSTQSC